MHSATSKLMFFIHSSVKVGEKKKKKRNVIGFEAISHCLCLLTFPAQVCRHSAPLFWVHFVWPLMRCCGVCVCACVRRCFTASAAFTGSDWSWIWIEKKKREKRSTSACLTPSIMTAPSLPHHSFPPRSHFYSHTSQPMSSHLHSSACKLYCSVSTNDAYQQWCVFSLHWHWKYKWGIIYNSPMDLGKKQQQLQ